MRVLGEGTSVQDASERFATSAQSRSQPFYSRRHGEAAQNKMSL